MQFSKQSKHNKEKYGKKMKSNFRRLYDQFKNNFKSGHHKYTLLSTDEFPVNRKKTCLFGIAALVVIIVILLAAYLWKDRIGHGAVVANGLECSKIGTDILRMKGSAADAAIATLFCEGVACPQSMGLGGGFLLTIYTRATKTIDTLQARETAPLQSHQDMFINRTVTGGLAVAVPGELRGYWELHQRYGKLPWSTLVQPTINLCREGVEVTPYLSRVLNLKLDTIRNTPSLAEIFINPKTQTVWNLGDKIKRLKLANTLEIIAKEGVDSLYNNGTLAQAFVNDVQKFGGIITIEDLQNYRVRWEEPYAAKLKDNKTVYTGQLPGAGAILTFILNVLNGYVTQDSLQSYQRLTETFKYAYAKRTELGDLPFIPDIQPIVNNLTNPIYADYIRSLISDNRTYQDPSYYGANFTLIEDHGTAHISVYAPNGDAVAVTSSINTILGAKIRSQSTGIILNDEMDDFATPGVVNAYGIPASPANFIEPGKRPLSSMCPTILVNENDDVQLIIGSAGGTKITSTIAFVIARHLWFNESLEAAVEARRIHHQLVPMKLQYESGLDLNIVQGLSAIGHKLEETPFDQGFSSLTAISINKKNIEAIFDPRRGGSVSYL